MAVLQVLFAAVLLLAASGYVAEAGGEPLPVSWKRSGGVLNNDKSHTWICHFRDSYGKDGGGKVDKSRCAATCPSASNKTAHNDTGHHSHNKQYLGYIGAIVAILFFGSNFVPVKTYETGDGVFFQWVLCIGIWLVGLVANFILDSPPFFLPTVVGGFFWTTGNMLVVPIIQMIGMTMGLTVWGVTNMLSGWVVGRFILHQKPVCPGLNYGGVATVALSVLILAFVKSEGKKKAPPGGDGENNTSERTTLLGEKTPSLEGSLKEKILGCCTNLFQLQKSRGVKSPTSINSDSKVTFSTSIISRGTANDAHTQHEAWTDKLGVWPKRILGFSFSLVAGVFFAMLFLPVQFLKLCDEGAHSCHDLNYLFGVYSGILFTSTAYCFIYSIATGNRPKVYPKVIFPGILSGILWGIAMAGWFLANQYLSMSVSFPLVTAGPGFVSSLWGIIVYREIKGWKNLLLFFIAFLVSLTGQIFNGLSQCTHC